MAAAPKKPFALRLSPELMEALEKWAADEFRSVNGQIEYLVSEALKKEKRLPKKGPESG
ncbi:MAG: Arc family DNA-binding protein [Cytophagaceae bacterium]|nr:Arc family DNA-binding protein [Cytophagaceae bacterium]